MDNNNDQVSCKTSKIKLNHKGLLKLDWEYDYEQELNDYKLLAKILPKRKKDGISISAIILGFMLQALDKSPSVVTHKGRRWIYLNHSIIASAAEVSIKAADKHVKKLLNQEYIIKRKLIPGKKKRTYWYSTDRRIEGLSNQKD